MIETRQFLKLERRLFRGITRQYRDHWAEVHRVARETAPPKPPKLPAGFRRPGFGATHVPTRRGQVLDAARRLAEPGQVVRLSDLAAASGIPVSTVSAVVSHLDRDGLWPYRRIRKPGAGRRRRRAV